MRSANGMRSGLHVGKLGLRRVENGMLDSRRSRFRRRFLVGGLFLALGSLAYRFIVEPKDRLMAVIFAVGVLGLVVLILAKSRDQR